MGNSGVGEGLGDGMFVGREVAVGGATVSMVVSKSGVMEGEQDAISKTQRMLKIKRVIFSPDLMH